MDLYIGTSGYSYKEWKGKFYPAKIAPDQMLSFYSDHFRTVEINGSFYRLPTRETLSIWEEQAKSPFLFAIKAPQTITHIRRLKNCQAVMKDLMDNLGALEEKCGPVLFQLPSNFKADPGLLQEFLKMVPRHTDIAFEFRNAGWFTAAVYDLLSERNAALCFNDTDLENMPFQATADWGYLRLRRTEYTDKELKAWRERIGEQKWNRAFVFFKHEDEATAPALAERLRSGPK